MWDMNIFGGGLLMLFGGLFMIVFWGGVIALIVWGIIKLTKRSESTTTQNALDIAKERYAKGEITREQFEHIKKDIR